MTTAQKHTPTPWRRTGTQIQIDGRYIGSTGPSNIMSNKTAQTQAAAAAPINEANAAFIVQAVNSHDMLLKALCDIQLDVDMTNPSYRRAWHIAETAIALAEGRGNKPQPEAQGRKAPA